jgi:hypothetical protein
MYQGSVDAISAPSLLGIPPAEPKLGWYPRKARARFGKLLDLAMGLLTSSRSGIARRRLQSWSAPMPE